MFLLLLYGGKFVPLRFKILIIRKCQKLEELRPL